jgi:hypothetical protein
MKDTPLFAVLVAAGAVCCLTPLLLPLLLGAVSVAAIAAWVNAAAVPVLAGIVVLAVVVLWLRRSSERRRVSASKLQSEGASHV